VELLISLSQILSTTTTRFRAEISMKLSQQTMRTVLDNINAAIYVADIDSYEVLFANKMIKDQIGGEVEGKMCWKTLQMGMNGPCDFCPNPKLLDADKNPTGLYRWEVYNPIIDKWFECTDAAIEWVDGRMVHMEYATDITDRRMAEEALRQSEELYRQLTVASPDAIIVCDTIGKIVYMSPRAKELFLISNDVDISELKMNQYIHPHDLKKFFELFQSLVEDNLSFLPQLLLMREDGSDFFGEISSASVKNDQKETTSVIMVIRDITERKMNEMELIRAKEKAEESDKLKSAFLANMSHEIRTPINGIIGFLNFLADDNLSPKRRHDYVSIVNNSSIQLVKLIDDIIDIAKIEAKQLSISPIVFHLNEFMNELQVFFDTYLHTNNKDKIALLLDDSQFIEPDIIFVDPMRLRQVITNLIGNAIKFTEKGYIGFGYRPLPPDKLEFWVEDSGIGLPSDQLGVIFERFRQVELTNSRKYGGTGLGLTISRSLVQMMGGDVFVESVEGEGSTFRFTISYLPVSPKDKPLLGEKNAEQLSGDQSLMGMSILLVEPGAMMCRYYEKLLASTGASLIRAETVKQWIDNISQPKHIDVVLANASVFKDEYSEALQMLKSVRADLPLVLLVPERNEYYYLVINDSQCNHVIEGTADYAMLNNALKKYL
jgi:PAS domain S-box-containing protein